MRHLSTHCGRERRILSMLADEASKSSCVQKHAAALVCGGKVLWTAHNNDKNCIVSAGTPNQHAEAAVLHRLLWNSRDKHASKTCFGGAGRRQKVATAQQQPTRFEARRVIQA